MSVDEWYAQIQQMAHLIKTEDVWFFKMIGWTPDECVAAEDTFQRLFGWSPQVESVSFL